MKTMDETSSSEHFLASLGLAIYEAELVKAFVISENKSEKLKTGKSASHRLLLLDQEIHLLKEKQSRVLGIVDRV